MATYSSHRLIIGKEEIGIFLSHWGYLFFLQTRVQICTPSCRVHMPINCVHTHLDLIRNLIQGTHFYEKFAVFECSK